MKKEWEDYDNPSFRGGISTVYKGLENIRTCYNEANQALAYVANQHKMELLLYEDIGLNKLFLNQSFEEIQQFIDEVFSPLRSDNDQNKELEYTLLTYFKNNRSRAKTADQLHIHINTLYQRLKKIEQTLNLI